MPCNYEDGESSGHSSTPFFNVVVFAFPFLIIHFLLFLLFQISHSSLFFSFIVLSFPLFEFFSPIFKGHILSSCFSYYADPNRAFDVRGRNLLFCIKLHISRTESDRRLLKLERKKYVEVQKLKKEDSGEGPKNVQIEE